MMNLTFNGNLGKDCEVRTTGSGTTVCNFTVGVSVGYGDNKRTEWVKCAIFGKRAESGLVQYLTKGAKVLVSGPAKCEAWQDNQGNARAVIEVNVNEIELIGVQQQAQGHQPQQQQPQPQQQPQRNPNASQYAAVPNGNQQPMHNGAQDFGINDDIPF